MSKTITVPVQIESAPYDVLIGEGLLGDLGGSLRAVCDADRVVIVTDDTVAELFGATVTASLEATAFDVSTIVVAPGEQSKSWEQAGSVLERMADTGLDRRDAVIALGGGVVGDLAGFCAGTYMRGIAFAQVPTTLLAQVDSSVGGKTAVDLTAGKNLAGAFVQPCLVVADTETLTSLSETEWTSGMAEVAKSAVLDSEESLKWIEGAAGSLSSRDAEAVIQAVRMSVAFKADVVSSDEREHGPRESLNLGHTFGHALEKVAGYGVVPHGHAVAEGMRFAAALADRTNHATAGMSHRQDALLDSLFIPRPSVVYDVEELRMAMSSDKKARGGRPRFVFATDAGEYVVTQVDEDVLLEELRVWVRSAEEGTVTS